VQLAKMFVSEQANTKTLLEERQKAINATVLKLQREGFRIANTLKEDSGY